jgi:hypothetical protein
MAPSSAHRRHHDWAEAQQAGPDGVARIIPSFRSAARRSRSSHRVLHDADEQDDADHADDVQIAPDKTIFR